MRLFLCASRTHNCRQGKTRDHGYPVYLGIAGKRQHGLHDTQHDRARGGTDAQDKQDSQRAHVLRLSYEDQSRQPQQEPSDSAVELSWRTASELDNLGFQLHRSLSKQGPWTRITPAMIPGLG